jgi:hypothetical protein
MPPSTSELVSLHGTARAVGLAFGAANAGDIAAAVAEFFGGAWSRDALLASTERYRSLVAEHAPHWLDEVAGIAEAAGVGAEDYLAYQGAKYRRINLPECFSYCAAPRHTTGGVTLFHKNRDNAKRPQCAYVKEVAGFHRFAATADTMDLGCMMAVNAAGLCACADVGYPDPNPCFRGMMNPDIQRLILERCASVGEALALLEELDGKRVYAGATTGTNWLFTDAGGDMAQVRHYHGRIEVNRSDEGFLVMRPDACGEQVLAAFRAESGHIRPALLNRLSRQTPILAESNISAMTASVPALRPDLFSRADFAVHHAGRAVYVPLYLGITDTPRPLLDGTLHRLIDSRSIPAEALAEFEAGLHEQCGRLELATRDALAKRGEKAARRTLTLGCARFAADAVRFLEQSEPRQP